MGLKRRKLFIGASSLSLAALATTQSSAQVAGLSKLPYAEIFGAAQVALAAIPYLGRWLFQGPPDKICSLSFEQLGMLRLRCYAFALALDSDGDGPVLPPAQGTIGVIPALAGFALKQDRLTISTTRDACFRAFDASENLVKELGQSNWLKLLILAGLETKDLQTLAENVKFSDARLNEFLGLMQAKLPVNSYDVEAAKSLSKQLAIMPESADKAIQAIKEMSEARQKARCFN